MDITVSWSKYDVNRIAVALLETDALTPVNEFATEYVVDAENVEYLVETVLRFVNE